MLPSNQNFKVLHTEHRKQEIIAFIHKQDLHADCKVTKIARIRDSLIKRVYLLATN
jgi:hypothetical protein